MIASAAWFAWVARAGAASGSSGWASARAARLVQEPLRGARAADGIAGCGRRAARRERRLGAHAGSERRQRPVVGDAGTGRRHVRARPRRSPRQAGGGLVEARAEPLDRVEEAGRTRDALLRAAQGDDRLGALGGDEARPRAASAAAEAIALSASASLPATEVTADGA